MKFAILAVSAIAVFCGGYFWLSDSHDKGAQQGNKFSSAGGVSAKSSDLVSTGQESQGHERGVEIWLKAGMISGKYSGVDPAALALTPEDFPGHPSWAMATFLRSCQAYIENPQDLVEGLETAKALDPTGEAGDYVLLTAERLQYQCRNVKREDLGKIDDLVREAAAAGDIAARSAVLLDKVNELKAMVVTGNAESRGAGLPESERRQLVDEAQKLALTGEPRAMLAAAQLGINDRLGVRDLINSAAWLAVTLQRPGQEFNADAFDFSFSPYKEMSPPERGQAKLRAAGFYKSCCQQIKS